MAKIPFKLETWLKDMSRKVVYEDGDSIDPCICSLGWLLERQNKLFIVTPEEELSEFEKAIEGYIKCYTGIIQTKEAAKQWASELYELVRTELTCQGNIVLSIEEFEKCFIEAQEKGRKEALKDLPRWKKANGKERFNERLIVLAGDNDLLCTNYAEDGEYYIPFSDLEKLPKED